MKSPRFDYIKVDSLAQVFDLLARHGDQARILAGGQTLMATLNMRLSEPALLIDIGSLAQLKGIAIQRGGAGDVLRIGALVTHTGIEQSELVAAHAPMLSEAAPHIGHRAIRNLGTLGGSLAYADPAAEWPACALALEASIVLSSARGERRIPAADFFAGLYTTAAEPDEIVAACEFPLATRPARHDFSELARRHGDYAIVGLAATAVQTPASGSEAASLADVRLAFFAIADRPVRARRAEAILSGRPIGDETLRAAGETLAEEIGIVADLTSSSRAKQQMAAVLMRRAVRRLCA